MCTGMWFASQIVSHILRMWRLIRQAANLNKIQFFHRWSHSLYGQSLQVKVVLQRSLNCMCSRVPKTAIYEMSLPENDVNTKHFLGKKRIKHYRLEHHLDMTTVGQNRRQLQTYTNPSMP